MSSPRRLSATLLLYCGVLPLLALSLSSSARSEPRHVDFPEPNKIKPAVAFWTRVYLEATTDGGFLHDSDYLGVVYELLRFDGAQGRARDAIIDRARDEWSAALMRFAQGVNPRNSEEARVLGELERALGRPATAYDLRAAADRIRFQLGQRDKFRAGVIRSGAYEDAMRDIFRQNGLPEDLAFLPHVESSFNTRAYSKYGAAGVWQFMRSTGRLFMKVSYEVDERLDPMVSTRAAARLLGENYAALQSWPLALTAYNHGRAGMLRAKKEHGDDIVEIIDQYRSRSFGFASRNFYAQFLAARRIMKSYDSYFGSIEREAPQVVDEVTLPYYVDVSDLREHLGLSPDVIREYNPALRDPIFSSSKRIPKGYVLRLPAGTTGPKMASWIAALPSTKRFNDQYRASYYEVRRGDTLSTIARRNGTSVNQLLALNNLSHRKRIYPGAVLQLPDRGGRRGSAPKAEPEPRPFELVRTAQAMEMPAPPRPKSSRFAQQKADGTGTPAAATPAALATAALSASAVPAPKPPRVMSTPGAIVDPEARDALLQNAAAAAQTSTPGAVVDPEVRDALVQTATAVSAVPAPPAPVPAAAAAAAAAAADVAPQRLEPVASLSEDSPWRRIRDNTIIVDADETLGHYAEWLELSTTRLRSMNRLGKGRSLRMGQRVKLDFSKVSAEQFLQRRIEYHKGISDDFFGSYEVVSVKDHRVRPGESIWQISTRTYGVPTWLIHRYNPDTDLTHLVPGSKLIVPVVQELASQS